MGVSIDDVHAAARRLRNRIHRTPVVSCQSMDDATGFAVFLKCENLQRAGAFKIRGALNKLLSLTADERRRGVVAFSSGNHAQGVPLAAQMTGTTSIICMPSDAPKLKLEATRRYGAEVVFYDRQRDDREAVARALAEKTDRVLVPPYDDYAIMAGQGTAALELFQDVPSLDALLAPVGGGGLMAGCSIVARTLFPGIQILGVETDTANDTHLSLRKGERVTIPPPPTIAEPPPAAYSSRRSRSSAGGPKAVHCSSVASSTRLRGMNGPAIARAAARSGAKQKFTRVPKWSAGTSRPASAANRCVRATPAAKRSGGMKEGIQPSPSRPARRMAASLLPPIQAGIGCWTGLGSTVILSSRQNSPSNVTSSSLQQRRMMASASSVRRPRSLNGTPAAWNSRSCSTPMPKAGSMRPPER